MPRNRTEIGLKMSAKPNLPLPTTTQGQRTEQMYQLADIFAAIFEALPDGHKHAIASTLEAA